MATKTKKRRTTRRTNRSVLDFSWDEVSPEWVSERLESITGELEQWGDDLQARGEKFRKESQKRIEDTVQQIQDELDKLPGVKRARELREQTRARVEKTVDAGVERLYGALHIARQEDIKKLDRKIAQLNRKLRALEKAA